MRLVATLFLAALTVAPTALRAEEASWTRSRRAAIVRSSLPGGVTLVVGSEPGAPVSAVCRIEATTRCDVLPSERLESALRSPASAFGAEEPGAHDRALSRLAHLALAGAGWPPAEARPALILAVGTDLPAEEVVALAARVFGEARAPRDATTTRTLRQSSERLAVVTDEVRRPRIYTAWSVVSPGVPERAALEVAQDLAVRHERARLPALLVGRALAHALGAVTRSEDGAGLLGLWLEPGERTSVDRLRRFVDGTLRQLRLVGPTAGEVARAKARLGLAALRSWEDVELRARTLGNLERTEGDATSFLALADAVASVTPDAVRTAVSHHLVDARRTTLEVYPPGWLPDDPRMLRYRLHTVAGGDTLASVARRFGVTVASLAQANDLAPSHALTPGDALWVPPR